MNPIMGQEIFGPLLPILTFETFEEVIARVEAGGKPLAAYLFSRDAGQILAYRTRLPFGGVGESGMGAYHGKAGFDAFSHQKSIVDKKTWLDLPMRYQPYTSRLYQALLHLFLR